MSIQNPWSSHYQSVWHERSGDPRFPHWLRVASLAYGSHRANGHALFKAGEISLVLATVNTETGEIKPLDRGSVQRAIKTAIEYGWLAATSCSRCLVVPGHAIDRGLGSPEEPCPQHDGSRKRRHSAPTSRLKVVS